MDRRTALTTVFRVRQSLCDALADLHRAASASDEDVAGALEDAAEHLDEALEALDVVPAERPVSRLAATG